MGTLGSLFLFYILFRLIGNPVLAIVLIFVIYYLLDRRFVGLLPSVATPVRRRMKMAALRRQTALNPHDAPAKLDLARLYIETRRYRTALDLLLTAPAAMQDSPAVLYDRGLCLLHLGQLESGEDLVRRALEQNASLRYGEPWLRLAASVATVNPGKALAYLREFQSRHYSSCESEYRMSQLLARLGDAEGARGALERCVRTYRALPKFRRRTERRWALLALLRRFL